MATISEDQRFAQRIARNLYLFSGTITLGTYATDGVDISDITDYFRHCNQIMCESKDGFTFEYDYTNSKLKVYLAGVEVAEDTDLETSPGAIRFISIGTKA